MTNLREHELHWCQVHSDTVRAIAAEKAVASALRVTGSLGKVWWLDVRLHAHAVVGCVDGTRHVG